MGFLDPVKQKLFEDRLSALEQGHKDLTRLFLSIVYAVNPNISQIASSHQSTQIKNTGTQINSQDAASIALLIREMTSWKFMLHSLILPHMPRLIPYFGVGITAFLVIAAFRVFHQ